MKPGHRGLTRVIQASRYSIQGLAAAWKHESAFRQEVTVAAILIPAAFWLGQTAAQIAMLIAVVALVLIVELLNSAIEATVDRMGSERHELAGRAKDMGSAAVAISLLLTLVTWLLIAWFRFV